MAGMNCFSHTSCGPTAFALLHGIGYVYHRAGENIAKNNYLGSETVEVAMAGFIHSPGHLANILDARFTKVGVGVATDVNGMYYFAVVFSGP
jgi:uncharacterized protein YkwD